MGIMTRLEMRNEVAGRIGRSDLNTDIDVWLYRALLDLSTYRRFYENWKEDTTITWLISTESLTLPTDFYAPIRLEYNNAGTITVIPYKDIIMVRDNYSSSAGLATMWARVGGSAHFDKTSDQEYTLTLYYKYRPADFASDAATSPIGGEWDEALIRHATASAFSRMREWQLADVLLKQYYSYVKGRIGTFDESEQAYNESIMGDPDIAPFVF